MNLAKKLKSLKEKMNRKCANLHVKTMQKLAQSRAQGTTEYAILVGVLVVIAILAIVLFKPKLQELWNAIVDGMKSL